MDHLFDGLAVMQPAFDECHPRDLAGDGDGHGGAADDVADLARLGAAALEGGDVADEDQFGAAQALFVAPGQDQVGQGVGAEGFDRFGLGPVFLGLAEQCVDFGVDAVCDSDGGLGRPCGGKVAQALVVLPVFLVPFVAASAVGLVGVLGVSGDQAPAASLVSQPRQRGAGGLVQHVGLGAGGGGFGLGDLVGLLQ
jgi:hypothetical protein